MASNADSAKTKSAQKGNSAAPVDISLELITQDAARKIAGGPGGEDTRTSIIDLIPQAIVVLAPDGKAVYANRVALEYTGLSLVDIQAVDFRARVFHPAEDQRLVAERPNAFLNKRWHEYTGLSPEESHGWGWQAAFYAEDIGPLMELWRELLISGQPGEIEARVRRYDGIYRWFLIRMEPFRDESGKIIRWYGTSTDIEDRKQAEEKLRQDERELRQLIDFLPQHVLVLDAEGTLVQPNQTTLNHNARTPTETLNPH